MIPGMQPNVKAFEKLLHANGSKLLVVNDLSQYSPSFQFGDEGPKVVTSKIAPSNFEFTEATRLQDLDLTEARSNAIYHLTLTKVPRGLQVTVFTL